MGPNDSGKSTNIYPLRSHPEYVVTAEQRGLVRGSLAVVRRGGFIEPITKELPMGYAVELNRLIQLQIGWAVG